MRPRSENRATIADKIAKVTGDTDALTAQEVKEYERSHKGRAGVIENAEKRIDRS